TFINHFLFFKFIYFLVYHLLLKTIILHNFYDMFFLFIIPNSIFFFSSFLINLRSKNVFKLYQFQSLGSFFIFSVLIMKILYNCMPSRYRFQKDIEIHCFIFILLNQTLSFNCQFFNFTIFNISKVFFYFLLSGTLTFLLVTSRLSRMVSNFLEMYIIYDMHHGYFSPDISNTNLKTIIL
ncbi:hypothetical protein L9F63_000053, partial [Diploptera punctata]